MGDVIKKIVLSVLVLVICLGMVEGVLYALYGRPLLYDYDDKALYVLKPNQHGFPLYYLPRASINSMRTRGNELQMNPDMRVVVMGGSDVFGVGLLDEETFSAQLQAHLRMKSQANVEVVNAGVGGYGLFQMVALLRKMIGQYKPDKVVLLYPLGYIYRQPLSEPSEVKLHMLIPFRYLTSYHFFKVLAIEAMSRFGVSIYSMPTVRDSIELPSEGRYKTLWTKEREHFLDLIDVCKNNGVELVVVGYGPQADDKEKYIERNLRSLLHSQGIPLYEFYRDLRAKKYFVRRDGHPSPAYFSEILKSLYAEGFDTHLLNSQ